MTIFTTIILLENRSINYRDSSHTNVYTAPPWAIGKQVTLKADQSQVTLYYQEKKIAVHNRCWQRGMRIETPSHKEQVKKLKRKLWLDKDIAAFSSLGAEAVAYLEALARARQPIKKNVSKLLGSKRRLWGRVGHLCDQKSPDS